MLKFKNKKKRIRLWLIMIVLLVTGYLFIQTDWPVTRLAELTATVKLGHKTQMGLFLNDNDCYHINYLKIYNRDQFQELPVMTFQNVFLKSSSGFTQTINYDSVECYCGDIFIIVFPDGSTNLHHFPLLMPRNISFNNIRVRINQSSLSPEMEYTILVNGKLERNPDASIKNISITLHNSEGELLASILTNPAYNKDGSQASGQLPYIIKDFNLANMLRIKDSAKIIKYYPAIVSLMEHFSDKMQSRQ